MTAYRRAPLALLIALSALPGLASAQAAAPANPMGPPIAGVCLLGRDSAIAGSKAGQASDVRLRQLGQGVQTELTPEQQAIVAENTSLKALAPAQRPAPRLDALEKRAAAFTQLQQLRTAQMQATRAQAVQQILKEMDVVLGPVSASRHCSVVFERGATYGFNPGMDLTAAVIQALDTRMPTINFNLATPDSVKR